MTSQLHIPRVSAQEARGKLGSNKAQLCSFSRPFRAGLGRIPSLDSYSHRQRSSKSAPSDLLDSQNWLDAMAEAVSSTLYQEVAFMHEVICIPNHRAFRPHTFAFSTDIILLEFHLQRHEMQVSSENISRTIVSKRDCSLCFVRCYFEFQPFHCIQYFCQYLNRPKPPQRQPC